MAAAKSIDLAQLPAWLKAADRNLQRNERGTMDKCKLVLVAETKKNFDQGRGPDGSTWKPLIMSRPRGGNKPLRDRGLLMASITTGGQGHVETITDTTLIWGTNLEYAATHQHGATITPTRGRALAIPVTPEAYRAGSPRNMPGLVMLWRRGAQSGVLVERGSGGRGRLHFVLKKSVTIPARPFLGWTPKMVDRCSLIIAEDAEDRLNN